MTSMAIVKLNSDAPHVPPNGIGTEVGTKADQRREASLAFGRNRSVAVDASGKLAHEIPLVQVDSASGFALHDGHDVLLTVNETFDVVFDR